MPPHLLRCQRIAVAYYSFNLGRLEAGAPSTFAHLGYEKVPNVSKLREIVAYLVLEFKVLPHLSGFPMFIKMLHHSVVKSIEFFT